MTLCDETINFLIFVLIGAIFSIIFDFFRAIRKFKKVKAGIVNIQDILYFIIIGIILVMVILNIQKEAFRLYLILAIILGVLIYISVIGNKIMKLFLYLLKTSNIILGFIFLPLKLFSTIFNKQLRKIKKYVVDCCKKISYMIKFYHTRVEVFVAKCKNDSKTKERRGKYDKKRKTSYQ